MNSLSAASVLMARITHQLRPPDTGTLSPCTRCCRPSPGGQPCARCLTDELGGQIGDQGIAARWLESTMQAIQDEKTVLRYALQANPSGLTGQREKES